MKTIWIATILVAIVIASGAIFASAQTPKTEIEQKEIKTNTYQEPCEATNCNCQGTCGGTCNIKSCGCRK
ncbi:hypothetical protein KO361_06165 [Candidatus Woesearchaeota archaeon]|nr:hypothetical protein [Candidatus Woesearchaeota archaeon]